MDYYWVLIVEEMHIYVSGNDSFKSYSIEYPKRRLQGRANGVSMGGREAFPWGLMVTNLLLGRDENGGGSAFQQIERILKLEVNTITVCNFQLA